MSEVIENKIVLTRKAHKCSACYRNFEKATEMIYQVSVDADTWYHDYYCHTCREFVKRNYDRYNFEEPITDSYPDVFEDEWEKVRVELEGVANE